MRPSVSRAATLIVAAACVAAGCGASAPPASVRVAAAADLAGAFPDIASAFTTETGTPVELSFASSGVLARQVEMGAPFDAFASADAALVDRVIQAGACRADTRVAYATGHLDAWWREESVVAPPRTLADLADARFGRIAIANPEFAPYGRAAREALVNAGVWDSIQPRLVFAENVQQALRYASTGNADVALVGRSLSKRTPGGSLPIDGALHAPLSHVMAACTKGAAGERGLAFVKYVTSARGQAILAAHGFGPPGEPPGGSGSGRVGHPALPLFSDAAVGRGLRPRRGRRRLQAVGCRP